jgi:hypothetical protein
MTLRTTAEDAANEDRTKPKSAAGWARNLSSETASAQVKPLLRGEACGEACGAEADVDLIELALHASSMWCGLACVETILQAAVELEA